MVLYLIAAVVRYPAPDSGEPDTAFRRARGLEE